MVQMIQQPNHVRPVAGLSGLLKAYSCHHPIAIFKAVCKAKSLRSFCIDRCPAYRGLEKVCLIRLGYGLRQREVHCRDNHLSNTG